MTNVIKPKFMPLLPGLPMVGSLKTKTPGQGGFGYQKKWGSK